MNVDILLMGEDEEFIKSVLSGYHNPGTKMKTTTDPKQAIEIAKRDRPNVIINAFLDENLFKRSKRINSLHGFLMGADYDYFELSSRSMDRTSADSILHFLSSYGFSTTVKPSPSVFAVADGRSILSAKSKRSSRTRKMGADAVNALTEAREAIAGLASFEDDPSTIGNRVAVPLSRDVLNTIDGTLAAGISLAKIPVGGRRVATSLKSLISFLRDAESVIKQVQKTAAATVQAAGVLGVLALTIATAISKVSALIASLNH